MIPATKPCFPRHEVYQSCIDGIWKRNWLTKIRLLANDPELRFKEFLKVNPLLFVTYVTSALQMAIKNLNLKCKIITMPFFVAATNNCIGNL